MPAVAPVSAGAAPYTPAGAVIARVDAEPALAALLPGGAHRGVGPPDLARPYATVNDVSATDDRSTGDGYVQEALLIVSLFGDDTDALVLAVRQWRAVFNPRNMLDDPMPLDAGYLMSADSFGDVFAPKEQGAPEGTPEFQVVFQMWVQVGRSSR